MSRVPAGLRVSFYHFAFYIYEPSDATALGLAQLMRICVHVCNENTTACMYISSMYSDVITSLRITLASPAIPVGVSFLVGR